MSPRAVPAPALGAVERYCEERTPPHLRGELRLDCSVRGGTITISERRAPWDPRRAAEWTTSHIAQLRYRADDGTWSLHWRGSDDRWHPYDGLAATGEIGRLLGEIDADPSGIFWG